MNKAVFLDKDGTLVEDVPYNVDPALIRLVSGAADALRILKANGYLLILISNQSGVAQGYFSENALQKVETKLQAMLQSADVQMDAMYFCPHHPKGKVKRYAIECACRKPNPGMILEAANKFNIDLTRSWMIGDILNDVEAGNRAGCKTILIDNGNETEWKISVERRPTLTAQTLLEAARSIIHKNQRELV